MRTINVVAAVIKSKNSKGEPIVFATQRGYGPLKGGWDFPGGKIEPAETPEQALKREIIEELDTKISVVEFIDCIEHDYPEFHLTMKCYLCEVVEGELRLTEHLDAKWLTKRELNTVDWLPADAKLLKKISEIL